MISLDLETTGIDARKYAIVSVGAVEIENPDNCFYEEIQFDLTKLIDPRALEINGFTEKNIKDPNKKNISEVLRDFVDWTKNIENVTLLAHNAWFEKSFLVENLGRKEYEKVFGIRVLDLYGTFNSYCRTNYIEIPMRDNFCGKKIGWWKTRLDCSIYWVTREPKPHNALTELKCAQKHIID